jgi:hypothetical protein
MAGVKQELWTGELIKRFRFGSSFLNAIPDHSSKVNNDIIHLVDVGADPNVIVGNIPNGGVPIAQRTDLDVPISLEQFLTENTAVTDEELYALSYNKIASVVEQHADVLDEKTLQYAAHKLAPAQTTMGTAVKETTGDVDSNNQNFKACTLQDIINLATTMDTMGVPRKAGERILLLGPHHSGQLVKENVQIFNQVVMGNPSEYFELYGFRVYLYGQNPTYNDGSLQKNALGAVAAPNDRDSSIAFYAPRMFKARGTTKMHYSDSAQDPVHRRNVVGFTQRFITCPKKVEAMFALVSGR